MVLAIIILPQYYLFVAANIVATSVALMGLVILVGNSGQISLGHGAFMGLGAYAYAIAMEHVGLPYWAAVPFAGLVCFGLGWLFGYPALRLEGLYLALATFALAIVFPQLIKFRWLGDLTGGTMGMVLGRPESVLPTYVSVDESLFLFTSAWGLAMYLLAVRIGESRLALSWQTLRDHRLAAEAVGVNRTLSYNAAFAVSAMYAGIGGALGIVLTQFVAPDTFGFFLSLTLMVGLVVGGVTSLLGAILGAAFIQFIPNLAESVSKAAPWAVYGIVLLVIISIMPNGLGGLLRRARGRLARRRP
jgi:branched-chain amino acid transport system permease protein